MSQEPGGITTHSDRDPFHYAIDHMASLAGEAGLNLESVSGLGSSEGTTDGRLQTIEIS